MPAVASTLQILGFIPDNLMTLLVCNKLHNDYTLVERSALQPETIMEMLEVCLRTTYFQVVHKLFQQKYGMSRRGGGLFVTYR
jgi:hypothetical protein